MAKSMLWQRVFRAAFPLLFVSTALAAHAALPPGVTEVATVEGITEYRLGNGLRVVLFPDAGSPSTSVNVTYLVGSRHESYGETGMAHLLEHMVFKGTPTSGNLWDSMNKRGMRFNGSTWYDRTNYFETFNASPADLEWAIAMEADRMVNSRVDRKDLDTEMTVVRNEMERGENNVGRVTTQRLIASAFRWHNYGKETIGARSDVEGVDIDRLRAFYRTYYQPDNAVVVIAGAFDVDQTLGWIAKHFGAIPKPARVLPRMYTQEPVQDGERLVTIRRVGDQQLLGVAYHVMPGAHPDAVAVEALASLMTSEPSGRLYKSLVETRKATGVSNFWLQLYDPGFVAFYAQVPVSDSIDPAREAAITTLEGVAKEPITAAEVDRARARALKGIDEVLADPTRFGVRLSESIAAGDWRLFFITRDRWRSVTPADVQRVAVQYLKPANRAVAQFIPDAKPDRAPTPPTVDVAALVKDYKGDPAAAAGELFAATPANLEARTQRVTLANGMKVALLPKKTRGQTVKIALQIDQGDENSLSGTGSQGSLAADMLARGTAKRSRQEITDAIDRYRAKVNFRGTAARTGATAETVRDQLPDTLRLIAEMLREPSVPRGGIREASARGDHRARELAPDPEAIARRAVRRYGNPYPEGDPRYVPTVDEEITRVRKTTVEDVKRFHSRFVGGTGEIAIVGDFDVDAVKRILAESFGTWAKAAPYARVPEPLVKKTPTVLTFETPDKANAALSGDLSLSINDESSDYGATAVASFILGETGSSRLWKRIRERDGLSYGVYSYVGWNSFEPNSTLNLVAIFAPQNRARLATALSEEFARAAREGFTDAEVADAKASVLKRRLLQRTQDANVAAALLQQAYRGRTFEFSAKGDAAIAAATTAEINAAFRKYVQPEALALVYAGDLHKAMTMLIRKLFGRALAPLFAAFVALSGHAALPTGITQGATIEGVTEYKLANGLTVLLFPDASQPKTTVNVTYRVGSAHESYGETGMAHLLEHMVFKGTPSRGNIMQELGRRGMSYNGSTDWDRTNYFQSFTASDENLDWALQMEADRMVNSFIRRSDLDSEMTVVRNEFESGENNPQLVLFGKMLATAYQWHNYGHLQIGARSDIENVDIGRLQAFYRLYYQPDNAVLIVAGKLDPDPTLALIAKYFGPIPKPTRKLPAIYTQEPVQDGERSATLRRIGNSQFLGLMYHTVRGAHPDYVASDVLGDVMTVAPSGRLYKALVEAKKATAVQAWSGAQVDPGTLTFFAQIPEGQAVDPAREAMFATIAEIARNPITETEVARIRARAAKYFADTMASPEKFGVAISESIALGDWRLFFLQRDRYRTVKPEDVQRVALDYLKRSNLTIGEFLPDPKPDRAPVPATVDVAAMVKDYKGDAAAMTGEVFDPTPANLDQRTQRFTLPNGLKVALLPKKTRGETVNFNLSLHFGDEKSVFGKASAGALAGGMLMRGTAKRSRQEIDDTFDKLRAKVGVTGSQTAAAASGQTYRAQLPEVLRLTAEVLREPSFPATELDQLKRARSTSLEASRTDPQAIASRALSRHGNPYPAGDPRYSPTIEESIANNNAVTLDDIKQFHREFYGASDAELSIVGDFDVEATKALVTQLFGEWKSPSAYTRVPEPFRPNQPASLRLVVPDKANAFLIGMERIPVNDLDPDYPALLVMSFILGDSSSARIPERLRQKDGLSYSAGTFFQPSSLDANSSIGTYAIFAPENLARVRTGFAEEFDRAVKDGFTDAEIAAARQGLLQERRLQRTEDGRIAGALASQAFLGRTYATSGAVDAAIEKLTPQDVNAVLRKYLKPGDFAYAFAGDFDKK